MDPIVSLIHYCLRTDQSQEQMLADIAEFIDTGNSASFVDKLIAKQYHTIPYMSMNDLRSTFQSFLQLTEADKPRLRNMITLAQLMEDHTKRNNLDSRLIYFSIVECLWKLGNKEYSHYHSYFNLDQYDRSTGGLHILFNSYIGHEDELFQFLNKIHTEHNLLYESAIIHSIFDQLYEQDPQILERFSESLGTPRNFLLHFYMLYKDAGYSHIEQALIADAQAVGFNEGVWLFNSFLAYANKNSKIAKLIMDTYSKEPMNLVAALDLNLSRHLCARMVSLGMDIAPLLAKIADD
ncbi:MAG: hypothetical protein LBV04_02265, partial [Deferribacteraceae bacterium]|nr:hypothetical protein [Deferribacteraceae bacterium]